MIANANLIAAAPDMLAALETAIAHAENGGVNEYSLPYLKAVVAKARGIP
jgi:hypothetical protein